MANSRSGGWLTTTLLGRWRARQRKHHWLRTKLLRRLGTMLQSVALGKRISSWFMSNSSYVVDIWSPIVDSHLIMTLLLLDVILPSGMHGCILISLVCNYHVRQHGWQLYLLRFFKLPISRWIAGRVIRFWYEGTSSMLYLHTIDIWKATFSGEIGFRYPLR